MLLIRASLPMRSRNTIRREKTVLSPNTVAAA